MSVSFYIKNPKKLFRHASVLTVRECFQLSSQQLAQFSFNEYDEHFDFQQFLSRPLSDFECLLLGVNEKSGRGFELSFDGQTQEYAVREFTPSTLEDWQIALQYLADLSRKLKQPIVCETGETFTADTIQTFDFKSDMQAGISMVPFEGEDDMRSYKLYGVIRPVALNKEFREKILADNDPVAAFSRFMREIQWLDAYSAQQIIARENDTGEYIGFYTLSPNLPTILPYHPSLEYNPDFDLSDNDIGSWQISLHNSTKGSFTELPYDTFIARLPKEKYRFIDAAYILLDAFTENELAQLSVE
ncbi:DUF4299 family protein [Eikenella sp. S3360]|uniref:DUF4299 family protein n=1 Tax=Eikenella glucosivorans TaxID=2766967 RepID=A0ABS0NA33_9NEIS|nr:DUF4299 family protein [Eikenella glucosivorans]MBH5329183.1 DUF4299 family protein [Eikenella glucosivorans]